MMNPSELLQFDENGRLNIEHECDVCSQYPLEDMNEPCLDCGYSQVDLIDLRANVTRTNLAIDMYNSKNYEGNITVIETNLTLTHLTIGGDDVSKISLADLNESGSIGCFAPYVNHDCKVIIYPQHVNEWYDMRGFGDF